MTAVKAACTGSTIFNVLAWIGTVLAILTESVVVYSHYSQAQTAYEEALNSPLLKVSEADLAKAQADIEAQGAKYAEATEKALANIAEAKARVMQAKADASDKFRRAEAAKTSALASIASAEAMDALIRKRAVLEQRELSMESTREAYILRGLWDYYKIAKTYQPVINFAIK